MENSKLKFYTFLFISSFKDDLLDLKKNMW
jgi:hypothetical protein